MNTITLSIKSNTEDLPEDIVDSLTYSEITNLILSIDSLSQDIEFTEELIRRLIESLKNSVDVQESLDFLSNFQDGLKTMEYFEEQQ